VAFIPSTAESSPADPATVDHRKYEHMTIEELPGTDSGLQSAASGAVEGGETKLRGNLGVLSLMATVIAFNGPLAMLAGFVPVVIAYGNGLSAPVTYIVLGLVVMVFAVGLNAMAARMTHPGAFYTYVTAGAGRPAGLAAGVLALVTYVALGSGTYALFAIMGEHLLRDTFNVTPPPWWVLALIAWAVCTVLSLYNIELSAKVLGVFMICELALVLIFHAFVLTDGGPEGRAVPIFSHLFDGSFAMAMIFGALCLTGFESLQVFRSETRDAARAVPRATYLSVMVLAVLYALGAYAYIVAYGPSKATTAGAEDATGSVLDAMRNYIFPAAGDIANVLLLTSVFAACLAIQNISARYFFNFGRDGVLPVRIGEVNLKHGSPMAAAMLSGVLMVISFLGAAVVGSDAPMAFTILTGLGGFWLIGLWVATSVSVVVFFRRRRSKEQISVWKVVVAPTFAATVLGAIFVLSAVNIADVVGGVAAGYVSLALLAAMVIGGVVLGFWYRSNRPDTYRQIGNQSESVDF
jgi:amino acid transporter